jgi:hypothetical protein
VKAKPADDIEQTKPDLFNTAKAALTPSKGKQTGRQLALGLLTPSKPARKPATRNYHVVASPVGGWDVWRLSYAPSS